MRSLAIIPARGGSKRLRRKNIKDFMGLPIISYSIIAAKQCGCFDKVVVSTEDEEIARIAEDYGAEVAWRNPVLATDEARVVDVCEDYLISNSSSLADCGLLCVLYPTAPLRNADDIRAVHRLVSSGDHSSALAVTKFPLPVHQAIGVVDGQSYPVFPELFYKRSSEVPEYYVDNGSTYVTSTEYFLNAKNLISNDVAMHVMPWSRSIDIDTQEDFLMAEFFGKRLLPQHDK